MGSRSCLIFFVLRVWYLQVPSEPGIRLHSAEDLESGFGDRIRQLGQEYPMGQEIRVCIRVVSARVLLLVLASCRGLVSRVAALPHAAV